MKNATAILFPLAMLALAGCPTASTPTPSPTPATAIIPIAVFHIRDINDPNLPPNQRVGSIFNANEIRSLVSDMINSSAIMAGQRLTFDWPGQSIQELVFDFGTTSHLTAPYFGPNGWVQFCSLRPQFDPNRINIFFVGTIIDSSNPNNFMGSYTLDPNANNEPGV